VVWILTFLKEWRFIAFTVGQNDHLVQDFQSNQVFTIRVFSIDHDIPWQCSVLQQNKTTSYTST